MMTSRFAAFALLAITMSTGCAVSSVDEDIDTSTAADALTASGPKLSFADGQEVPLAAVRSSDTHAALTALPVGDAGSHPLELVVPPGRGPAILFARSGEDASLTLGSAAYGLGPVNMVEVSFPPLDAKTRPTSLITIAFKPTELKYLSAKGDVSKASSGPSPSPSVTTFSLALGSAKSTPSMAINALTLDPAKPGADLSLRVAASEAAAWTSWSAGERRDGTLTYAGPAGSVVIALQGVSVKTVRDDSLQSYSVHLYSEHAKLQPTKTDG